MNKPTLVRIIYINFINQLTSVFNIKKEKTYDDKLQFFGC